MKPYRFEMLLGAALLGLFWALCQWQAPVDKLTSEEIDTYLGRMAQSESMPEEEIAQMSARIRAWAERDDGQPVYMLNLMRYYDQLRPMSVLKGFEGDKVAANAHYEDAVLSMVLKRGVFPMLAAETQDWDTGPYVEMLGYEQARENLDRVLVVRYPSRRAYLDMATDPEYLDIAPYKLGALGVALIPMSGELVIPDLRWAAAAVLLLIFMLVGWWRSARRAP